MSIILDPGRETSGERLVQRPSGLIVSESVECGLQRPIGIDLFCGCGGFCRCENDQRDLFAAVEE